MNGYNPTLLDFGLSDELNVGGAGGTRNYDKLYNTPITNIKGTEDKPVKLSDLASGNFSLTGFYQADVMQQTDAPISVHVIAGDSSSVVYYFVLSDLDLTLVLLKFVDGQLVLKKTRSMSGDEFDDF